MAKCKSARCQRGASQSQLAEPERRHRGCCVTCQTCQIAASRSATAGFGSVASPSFAGAKPSRSQRNREASSGTFRRVAPPETASARKTQAQLACRGARLGTAGTLYRRTTAPLTRLRLCTRVWISAALLPSLLKCAVVQKLRTQREQQQNGRRPQLAAPAAAKTQAPEERHDT